MGLWLRLDKVIGAYGWRADETNTNTNTHKQTSSTTGIVSKKDEGKNNSQQKQPQYGVSSVSSVSGGVNSSTRAGTGNQPQQHHRQQQ